jgi:hypothetical protein
MTKFTPSKEWTLEDRLQTAMGINANLIVYLDREKESRGQGGWLEKSCWLATIQLRVLCGDARELELNRAAIEDCLKNP